VRESDRQRGAYDRIFMKVDWADPLLYHLVLNTGRLKEEEAAGLLVARIRATEVVP
jgi:cytidylate kinase